MSLLLNHKLNTISNIYAFMDYMRDNAMPTQLAAPMVEAVKMLERVFGVDSLMNLAAADISTKGMVAGYLRAGGSARFARKTYMEYAWAHYVRMVQTLEILTIGENGLGCVIARNAFGYDQSLIDRCYEAYIAEARRYGKRSADEHADAKSYVAYASRLVKTGGLHAVRAYIDPVSRRWNHLFLQLDSGVELDYQSYLSAKGNDASTTVASQTVNHLGLPKVTRGTRVAGTVSHRAKRTLNKLRKAPRYSLKISRKRSLNGEAVKPSKVKQCWSMTTQEIISRAGDILH